LPQLDLPDGTARIAFERIGINPDSLRDAIAQQYVDALAEIGITSHSPSTAEAAPIASGTGLYSAKPEVKTLMRSLSERDDNAALSGAHVVRAIAAVPQGVAARALAQLGVDAQALQAAAESVISGQ
jgi:hypothetical protein